MADRWGEVLATVTGLLPAAAAVVVDGAPDRARMFADRLAIALGAADVPCTRLGERPGDAPTASTEPAAGLGWGITDAPVAQDHATGTATIADGDCWRGTPPDTGWDVVIWLRTSRDDDGDGEYGADVVVDLHDPEWPVIRRVADRLDPARSWYLAESRAFFAVRAAGWDTRFGDDLPAYAKAVGETGVPDGGVVLDAGCGTGRALPALRAAVGPAGTVVGLDVTPEMLDRARERAAAAPVLLLGDARAIPLADHSVDVVFAAGLVMHLPDLTAGLTELARVVRPGGRLAIFHPSGRAALAARHGRALRPGDPLEQSCLTGRLAATGWRLSRYDDPPERFFALADRT